MRKMANEPLLQCYNRGCGQKYNSNNNEDGKFSDSLQHKQ